MRFAIEAWAPEYGTPMGATDLEEAKPKVDLTVEVPAIKWNPIVPPATTPPDTILFTDGVRRVDASVWINGTDNTTTLGLCATYAAGGVLCDGRADIVAAEVERGLFCTAPDAAPIATRHASYPVRRPGGETPDELFLALQRRMGELEVAISDEVEADLIVVDGPLGVRHGRPATVGYIKTHRVAYLPPDVLGVITALAPGERTPVFLIGGAWARYSWYLRLPRAADHMWAGVVRCEVSADQESSKAIQTADLVAASLPRFASARHKDPRAPQNLYPIAGLERELRRRLGDPHLLYRDLALAAAGG